MNEINFIPINQTAANIIKGGFSEEFINRGNHFHSEIPIKTKKIPKDLENFTGRKYGRITVIGYVRKQLSKEERNDKRFSFSADGRGGVFVKEKK